MTERPSAAEAARLLGISTQAAATRFFGARNRLLEQLGEIPSGKASIRIGPHIMTVVEIKDNMIGKVTGKKYGSVKKHEVLFMSRADFQKDKRFVKATQESLRMAR